MFVKETDGHIICIEHTWADNNWIGLEGWLIGKQQQRAKVDLVIDGQTVHVENWLPRHDVCAKYKELNPHLSCGFALRIPQNKTRSAIFRILGEQEHPEIELPFEIGEVRSAPQNIPPATDAAIKFFDIVNTQHLRVLELGSRLVLPESKTKRHLFPGAASFVGFDIHPGHNVDVVGDAHKLSSYFPPESFDAVFSMCVLEHIAMPWVLVMEINKLLPIGGLTYHHAPQSWPIHAMPWDFYRFSHQGLQALFNKTMGFEVLKSGMGQCLRMSFDKFPPGYDTFPLSPGFGSATILAKKIADYDKKRFRWDVTSEDVLEDGSMYPR